MDALEEFENTGYIVPTTKVECKEKRFDYLDMVAFAEHYHQAKLKSMVSSSNVMISSLPDEDSIREYALDWCEKFGNETGDDETMRSIAYTSYRRGCQRVNRILSDES